MSTSVSSVTPGARAIGTFSRRSGRVVNLARSVVVASFLLPYCLRGLQPNADPMVVVALATYLGWCVFVLIAGWNDWLVDYRLGIAAHLVDIAVLAAFSFLSDDRPTPFFSLYVLLLFGSALRFSARATWMTALVLIVVFTSATALTYIGDDEVRAEALSIWLVHLTTLSMLMTWVRSLALGRAPRIDWSANESLSLDEIPSADALAKLAEILKADDITILWHHQDEPWVKRVRYSPGAIDRADEDPERFPYVLFEALATTRHSTQAIIFDRRRRRSACGRDGRIDLLRGSAYEDVESVAALAAHDHGLLGIFDDTAVSGVIVASASGGVSIDDLAAVRAAARYIGTLFARAQADAEHERVTRERANLALACDVHDGVLQSLTGTAFRLRGLQAWVEAGHSGSEHIQRLREDIALEQAKVREFINRLRSTSGPEAPQPICPRLFVLAETLSSLWAVACSVDECDDSLACTAWMQHEIHQIIRESVANAVRHGGARSVGLEIYGRADALVLVISDDGRSTRLNPVSPSGEKAAAAGSPWTIHARAKRLGGSVTFTSDGETRLIVELPLGEAA